MIWITILVVLSDQITKWFAVQYLRPAASIFIIPNIFQLSYVENKGIAFGLFQQYPHVLIILIFISVLLLIWLSTRLKNESRIKRIAYALILGGAIGNLIDRFRLQYVIDFLDFRVWPVFNLADSCITIGVIIFIWSTIKGK